MDKTVNLPRKYKTTYWNVENGEYIPKIERIKFNKISKKTIIKKNGSFREEETQYYCEARNQLRLF